MKMEIDRISNAYSQDTSIDEISFEDFFIVLELISNKYKDDENFRKKTFRELQMLLLDAIYNDNMINNINYGKNMSKILKTYDNVFTLNYDTNLDKYYDNVKHLHGRFDVLAPEYDINSDYVKNNPSKDKSHQVVQEFKHSFSNTIMSWFWLEKYGKWIDKEKIYGVNEFKNMSGHLDIVGMSPCNDEHLFIFINNSQIGGVTYYYNSKKRCEEIAKKIKKPITFSSVQKFWEKIK